MSVCGKTEKFPAKMCSVFCVTVVFLKCKFVYSSCQICPKLGILIGNTVTLLYVKFYSIWRKTRGLIGPSTQLGPFLFVVHEYSSSYF